MGLEWFLATNRRHSLASGGARSVVRPRQTLPPGSGGLQVTVADLLLQSASQALSKPLKTPGPSRELSRKAAADCRELRVTSPPWEPSRPALTDETINRLTCQSADTFRGLAQSEPLTLLVMIRIYSAPSVLGGRVRKISCTPPPCPALPTPISKLVWVRQHLVIRIQTIFLQTAGRRWEKT